MNTWPQSMISAFASVLLHALHRNGRYKSNASFNNFCFLASVSWGRSSAVAPCGVEMVVEGADVRQREKGCSSGVVIEATVCLGSATRVVESDGDNTNLSIISVTSQVGALVSSTSIKASTNAPAC